MQKKFLTGQCIVLGVTGGIAAYKAVEVASSLKKLGAEVQVVMTEAAQEFVQPLTFRAVTHNPVITDMFAEPKSWEVEHISLAQKADLFLIVPATANIIGKIANGIADDMLSTTAMATQASVLLAPAMNVNMYNNPILQSNIDKLSKLGYGVVEPASGYLACGVEGKGRLAAPEKIVELAIRELTLSADWQGVKVLVTAGGTQEPWDPVRYLGNHSSGKMGYAVAKVAARRGAEVLLVTAPTALESPLGVEVEQVQTAREMYEAVLAVAAEQEVIIKAAAVADYRPQNKAEDKIKKDESEPLINLERNPDILAELGRRKERQFLVGFAAESEQLLTNAQAKLKNKNLDLIVANDISAVDSGFKVDTNQVVLISAQDQQELPKLSKMEVAARLLDKIVELREE
ncbi:bifunctional phosphopantothenoylcysteine decarboxylase/phosphopantothenate--cysteine ligase CoaBC [Fuchsiella alkaliacetigena]|uniref:bifunctional phosphopantothenoylcysteine decarboxylase/phosphopantothenate--cysteine ligase CoaBC n=1 Tax=Fuchsiella alkaliacetigena TaxID=957042 RepID=UPI00200A56A5|nr:bifunctional phosphopantothenoylcysteine decarboxylase/phosphopantothenate--cysteine ligase CoaBC [Fuchsiella alkaliacetigena]MCK8824231.1 bifunctional phosphopantothenoylcysteine decarboxylase/phosphopantothenate--cysteine ligase CoaBC [Fuchsiella alkaliacetigena]